MRADLARLVLHIAYDPREDPESICPRPWHVQVELRPFCERDEDWPTDATPEQIAEAHRYLAGIIGRLASYMGPILEKARAQHGCRPSRFFHSEGFLGDITSASDTCSVSVANILRPSIGYDVWVVSAYFDLPADDTFSDWLAYLQDRLTRILDDETLPTEDNYYD